MHPLQKLLKKNLLPCKREHTSAVEVLKEKLLHLPPLQVPFDGKRILQTNASEKDWTVVLLVEIDGKRHICEHNSGRLSPIKLHYHSTFKETFPVKC